MTYRRRGYAKHLPTDNIPSDTPTKALDPTEFHNHIQVLLGQKQLKWTHKSRQTSSFADH
jgi:hypothetical protein